MFQVDEWLNKLFDGFRLNITKLADAKKEKEMLENTLREVNEFVVPDTEFLSDAVYFYDKELGNIVG